MLAKAHCLRTCGGLAVCFAVTAVLLAVDEIGRAEAEPILDSDGHPVSIIGTAFQPRAGSDDVPFTRYDGSLFGLQFSNPVDTSVAYQGNAKNYGASNDPMKGGKVGGVNVFGGGLALYDPNGTLVGAVGVSGDTSCADHVIAWKVRHRLNLDDVAGGVSDSGTDNIIFFGSGETFDPTFAHPDCGFGVLPIATNLPVSHPVGPSP